MKRYFVRFETEISGQEQGVPFLLTVGRGKIEKEIERQLKHWYTDSDPERQEDGSYTHTCDMYTEVCVKCDRYEEISEEHYQVLKNYLYDLS